MKPMAICSALVCSLLLSGCGGAKDQELGRTVADLEKRIASLEEAKLKASMRLSNLEIDLLLMKQATSETAWFDPQRQKAYQGVKTPVGQVLFVLERVEPYLDGFKVSFRVGNPSTANLVGFEAEVEWGPAAPEGQNTPPPPTKTVKVKFTETLRAGAWSVVTANIAPAKPDEIRRIGITPVFDSISLARGG